MRILGFRIENFRNLRLAECDSVPNFVVICGGNGCGKSALLEALMTAKEHAGAYGNFPFDKNAVSVDSLTSSITMKVQFSEEERDFVKMQYGEECPAEDEIFIEINKGGGAQTVRRSSPVYRLFSFYSSSLGSPGFFDYITAHRQALKIQLQNWDSGFLSDDHAKQSLAGSDKFANTKRYLAGLKMQDLQGIQSGLLEGKSAVVVDSLHEIRDVFNRFFAPLAFKDVYVCKSPFQFVVSTPLGDIDIDDLSSGEKEILNIFVRFHQLTPHGAVILFDEADAHLHPDLERRYLEELRRLAKGNQLLLTTHSPEMMIAAGSESLYTVLKEPAGDGKNQFLRVSSTDELHEALSEVMGSRGMVSFNQRIIFIEGEEGSVDRQLYEHFYPPSEYNVSFVATGNSATVRKTAERVNDLLTSGIRFQQYASIVDGDIERSVEPPPGGRLYQLPVYHVENFLLDEHLILQATKELMANTCPFNDVEMVRQELHELILSDKHLKPFARALLDARVANVAKRAWDAVYSGTTNGTADHVRPQFSDVENDARSLMERAIEDDTWKSKCKGRDLIKSYCGKHGFKYEHFRNLLISGMKEPPSQLQEVMDKILNS